MGRLLSFMEEADSSGLKPGGWKKYMSELKHRPTKDEDEPRG
jgi:hypothetical protein